MKGKLDWDYKVLTVKKLTWLQRIRHHYFVPRWIWNHTHIAQIDYKGKKLWVPIDPLNKYVNVDFIVAIWSKYFEKDYDRKQANELLQKQQVAIKTLIEAENL